MISVSNSDASDDDLWEACEKGRRIFMEHSAEACRDIAACFCENSFGRRLGPADRTADPVLLYFSDHRFRDFSVNPLFDEAWYLDAYEDVADSAASGAVYSGFAHFVIDGLREGRAPNATMFFAMSNEHRPDIPPRCRFDSTHYLRSNPFVGNFLKYFPIIDAYDFFCIYGDRLGHIASILHYSEESFDIYVKEYFDSEYYMTHYIRESLSAKDALQHYVDIGATKGHNPSDLFDETWYRLFYTDVGEAVRTGSIQSGFHHYVASGYTEKRRPKHDLRYALEARMSGISEPKLLQRAKEIERRMLSLPHEVSPFAKPRVWFCLPNLNPDLSFGGYKAVFEFMKAVVRTGRRIGIFVTEENSQNAEYFLYLEKDEALKRVVADAPYVNRSASAKIQISTNDIFVVYSVWDAYVVQPLLACTNRKRFLLFAQEYEPIFYESGSTRALTEAAYGYAHVPLFNSWFLTKYFREHHIGAFADPDAKEGQDFHVFEHLPTKLRTHSSASAKTGRTLAFYARPEMHAARNLFELGYLALRRLCAEGVFDSSWKFVGLGGLSEDHELPLGGDHTLQMVQKMPLDAYESFMSDIDVGLSLMFAPHPSIMPFEFAATGAIVVTNVYENRSFDDLRAICANILPCRSTIDDVAAALREAAARASDTATRDAQRLQLAGRRWDDVFASEPLETIFATLDRVV